MTPVSVSARVLGIAVSTALIVALTGCAAPEPVPTTAPTTPAAPAAEETPEPEPTRPTLDELVITAEGIGDLRVGHPVPQGNPELSLVTWNPTGCIDPDYPDAGLEEGQPWAGHWAPVFPASDPGNWPFWVVTDGTKDGPVSFIGSDTVPTSEGIRVGDTRAQLEAAHTSFDAVIHRELVDMYVMEAPASRLVIEVVTDSEWYPEYADRVLAMHVQSTSYEPFSIAATDAGSTCLV